MQMFEFANNVWDVNVDGASGVSDYVFMGVSDAFGFVGALDAS